MNDGYNMWQWKNAFKDHQKVKKRKCFLLEVYKQKTGWVSGDKHCSSTKSTTALINTTLPSTTINTNGERQETQNNSVL